MSRRTTSFAAVAVGLALAGALAGCSTAPKAEKKPEFTQAAKSSTAWFERNVSGLSSQVDGSAGFVIFPDVVQYGTLIGGGTWGRGALCEPDGTQVGWAAINAGSVGLQVGVQGLKMMMVLRDEATMDAFRRNQLTGSIAAMAVGGEEGGGAAAPFDNGVALYQGANKGLMAGVRVGLDYIRYEPMMMADVPVDMR